MENNGRNFTEKSIVYFHKIGRANTDDVLSISKERYKELGLRHIIISTSFGDTAIKALDYFEPEEMCIIGSMYGFREPGKQSLTDQNAKVIENSGAKVIRQTHLFAAIDRSIHRKYGGITPTLMIGQTFKLLGEGFKVCVETAVMAADSGGVPVDQEVMVIAGSYRGADTSVVLIPAHSNDFFNIQIKEIVCMPRVRAPKPQQI